jgi:hypothetical protein
MEVGKGRKEGYSREEEEGDDASRKEDSLRSERRNSKKKQVRSKDGSSKGDGKTDLIMNDTK